jgi:hypothetical protein
MLGRGELAIYLLIYLSIYLSIYAARLRRHLEP